MNTNFKFDFSSDLNKLKNLQFLTINTKNCSKKSSDKISRK